MKKRGTCLLPLHYGSAPKWLFQRMVRLSVAIIETIVTDFGPEEFLTRLSDPYWFQALGCLLGFDWHSSGLTTTVCGAIKEALAYTNGALSLFAAGGKGRTSRKTPEEIKDIISGFHIPLQPENMVYASRMAAKVDNTALQDGYQLYHHTFLFSRSGLWVVIQQGMNVDARWARRYHWISTDIHDFVDEPQKAICCDRSSEVLNMVAHESRNARSICADLSCRNPDSVIKEYEKLLNFKLPKRHTISVSDIRKSALKKILLSTYSHQPDNFERLLSIEGVGPKTIRALALISELVYDARVSRKDPVKYSFAHGGKDGHPYPINRREYDKSIEILEKALNEARIGRSDKKDAFKRLAFLLDKR